MAAMTVDFQLCIIFLLLLVFSLHYLYALVFKKLQKSDCDLPPSPLSLPVIGHLHLLLSFPFHKSLQKLSFKYGPLLHLRIFNIPIVLVSSASMAYDVFRTNDLNFASREGFKMENSLLFGTFGFLSAPYGDYWRFMKKILVTNLFGAQSMERTRLIRQEELKIFRDMLFDKAEKRETVDVGKEMMKLTNNSICRMIMGRKCSEESGEAEQIRDLVTKSLSLTRKFLILSTVGQLLKKFRVSLFEKEIVEVSERFDVLLEKIIKEHEEHPNKKEDRDMMDILLDICADENPDYKITRNQIKGLFVELFLGGTDTSAQTTQWIMAELINHPEILKRLRQEIESVVGKTRLIQETDISNIPYLQAVVKEGLRLHPPVPILGRNAAQGCKIGGFNIPQNTTMIMNTYAVMRDPKTYEDPDEFQPDRFISKGKDDEKENVKLNYLPFGSGRRGCPGSNLGYIFVGVAVGIMVQCFDWRVDGDKVNMEETGDVTLSMAHPLQCTPVAQMDPSTSFESTTA